MTGEAAERADDSIRWFLSSFPLVVSSRRFLSSTPVVGSRWTAKRITDASIARRAHRRRGVDAPFVRSTVTRP
jgi:hypothetical protein